MFYGIKIQKLDSGRFEVSCRDFPEFVSEHDTEQEAMEFAKSFVPGVMMLEFRHKKKAIPLPSKLRKGELAYYIPAKVQAKILFWNFMIEHGLKIADVARKLGITHSEAARFVDLTKDSASIDAIENALIKLGGSFDLSLSK